MPAAKKPTNIPETEIEVTKDPWRVMEEVFLPKEAGVQSKFVAVNGRTFMVPCGKRVQVPAPIAEAIRNSEQAMIEAEAVAEKIRGN